MLTSQFEQLRPSLIHYAAKRLPPRLKGDAEDIVQQIFIAGLSRKDLSPETLWTWCRRKCRQLCSKLRSKSRCELLDGDHAGDHAGGVQVDLTELYEQLDSRLSELSQSYERHLRLSLLGLTGAEIACVLGGTREQASMAVTRAQRQLGFPPYLTTNRGVCTRLMELLTHDQLAQVHALTAPPSEALVA